MNSKMWGAALLTGICMLASVRNAQGATIYYTNWSYYDVSSNNSSGSAAGTLTTPNGSLTVSYSGDLSANTQVSNAGTNYYAGYPSVYTNSTVSNLPTRSDILTFSQAYTAAANVLTFSAPVVNPILDIVSLGGGPNNVTYNFTATPVILSQDAAYFGGCSTCLTVSGNSLTGSEGSGVIEFVGTYSQLRWTVTGGENWNGLTVGVANSVSAVPEPSTFSFIILAFGLCGLGVRKASIRRQ